MSSLQQRCDFMMAVVRNAHDAGITLEEFQKLAIAAYGVIQPSLETRTDHVDPDEETPCPKRDDGLHCECWYGGNTCCGCGDGDRKLGEANLPTCAEVRALNRGVNGL